MIQCSALCQAAKPNNFWPKSSSVVPEQRQQVVMIGMGTPSSQRRIPRPNPIASFLSGSRRPDFVSKNVRSFGKLAAAIGVSENQLIEPLEVPITLLSGSPQPAHGLGIGFGFDPRCVKSALAAGNDDRADGRLFIDNNTPADRTVADDPELRECRRRDSGKSNGRCKHFEFHGRAPE